MMGRGMAGRGRYWEVGEEREGKGRGGEGEGGERGGRGRGRGVSDALGMEGICGVGTGRE